MTQEEITFLTESNAIEGVFTESALDDAKKAWRYLMDQDELSFAVIKETHRLLMSNPDAWNPSVSSLADDFTGEFRTVDVFVGMYKCLPPHLFDMFLGNWVSDTMRDMPLPNDRQLHIRYEKIHPFLDGNRRTGRMFMNWTRIKRLKLPLLVIYNDRKEAYYKWFK